MQKLQFFAPIPMLIPLSRTSRNLTCETPPHLSRMSFLTDCTPLTFRRILSSTSQSSQQQQNDYDDQYQSEPSARAITPRPAVWPGRNRTDQHQHQND